MKFFKSLVMVFLSTSPVVFAETTASITKTVNPASGMLVLSVGGESTSYFSVLGSDFPRGALGKTKTLVRVNWKSTSYPGIKDEQVRLCYYRPYALNYVDCQDIAPNSSGDEYKFNTQPFAPGAKVTITHKTLAGRVPPAYVTSRGAETVVFKYSY